MRSLFEHTLLTPVLHAARPLNKDPDLFYLQSHNLDEEKKSLGHFYDELSRPLVQLSDHFRQGHRIRIIE